MKHIKIATLLSFIFLLCQCSKDNETFNTYPIPSWSVDALEDMPNSFTAIITITDNLNTYSEDNDKVAAFIGDKCHGTGNLVKSDDGQKRVYFITVRGADTENGDIVFKYYNAKLQYLYQSTISIQFTIDGSIGTFDSPLETEFQNI